MEARLTMVLKGIARCMAPSGLKKALSLRVVKFALRVDEAVRSISQAQGQQRPLPERSSERFSGYSEVFEESKISSKDQILQRTGGQILEGFVQDRVHQLLVE